MILSGGRRLLAITALSAAAGAQAVQPDGGGVRSGELPRSWRTGGPNCIETPNWQIQQYNADFFIIRESGCTNYEKPFVFMLFGSEKAMLLDTGAGKSDIGSMVQATVKKWLARNGRSRIDLIVAHTHGHGDHVSGDSQFRALNDPSMPVTMVPLERSGMEKFYGIDRWPESVGLVDLGKRALDVVPIPGHDPLSVAFYDRQTGVLLSGDSLYPGRLYVDEMNFDDYTKSIRRLVTFTDGKVVAHVIGNHVEQRRTPYFDYPIGTMYQPDEHDLALPRADLLELDAALTAMHGTPRRMAMRDYTIWPANPAVWKALDDQRKETEQRQSEEIPRQR